MSGREGSTIVLIDAVETQVTSLKRHIPDVEWVSTSPDELVQVMPLTAVIVFARIHEEDLALSRCRSLRDRSELANTPILTAISIYQMPLGNEVKRLPLCDIIFLSVREDGPPIQREDLIDKLRRLESGSVQH